MRASSVISHASTDLSPMPTVSVIIKTFNHAPYIRQTLDSVLEQCFQDFEILITDDGSTDNTLQALKEYVDPRIHLDARTQNEGVSAAMNATIARARGRYFAIINSDDWMLPGRLRRQVDLLEAHADVSLVFGLPELVDEEGLPIAGYDVFSPPLTFEDYSRRTWLRQFFFDGNCLCAPTAMIRREAYESTGLYDRRLTNLQDLDMWVRMLLAGHRILFLPERLSAFRIRANNANASAPTEAARQRTIFETTRILRHFAKLDDEAFEEIFGQDHGSFDVNDNPSLRVAEIARRQLTFSHRVFALDCLFENAASVKHEERLREWAGSLDVFNAIALTQKCEDIRKRDHVISGHGEILRERDHKIDSLVTDIGKCEIVIEQLNNDVGRHKLGIESLNLELEQRLQTIQSLHDEIRRQTSTMDDFNKSAETTAMPWSTTTKKRLIGNIKEKVRHQIKIPGGLSAISRFLAKSIAPARLIKPDLSSGEQPQKPFSSLQPGVSGVDAWNAVLKGRNPRWGADIKRFSGPLPVIDHIPKFQLSQTDKFFCIGSCFARNLEEHLIYQNVDVLSKMMISPANEHEQPRMNGVVNKFTVHSMLNELEWVLDPPRLNEIFFEESSSGWFDLQLVPGIKPVDLRRAIERRSYLIKEYFARLRVADVVILTLGFNEVWKDSRSGLYLNATPSFASVRRDPHRYLFEAVSVASSIAALERICSVLLSLNKVRVILTVSPIPLDTTFSGKDVIVANTASKAVLRSAAEAVAAQHPSVDYYPSFDMVQAASREIAFREDCQHINDQTVEQIVGHFLRTYMDLSIEEIAFREGPYLSANPDVALAVRRGELTSGYHHWVIHGQSEGRSLGTNG